MCRFVAFPPPLPGILFKIQYISLSLSPHTKESFEERSGGKDASRKQHRDNVCISVGRGEREREREESVTGTRLIFFFFKYSTVLFSGEFQFLQRSTFSSSPSVKSLSLRENRFLFLLHSHTHTHIFQNRHDDTHNILKEQPIFLTTSRGRRGS